MADARPTTRLTILRLLKEKRELTAKKLATIVGISAVAIRKHLDALEQEGLVSVNLRHQSLGRPSYTYRLTGAASEHFPQDYRRMLLDLLQEVASSEGEQKLRRLFEARTERQRRDYERQLSEIDPDQRVKELARLRNEDGYMTALEEDDVAFVLRQYNCPVQEVSSRFRQACGCEIDLLRDLLGTKRIDRMESLNNGDASCTYRIPKRSKQQERR